VIFKGALPEEHLATILTGSASTTPRAYGALPTLLGGAPLQSGAMFLGSFPAENPSTPSQINMDLSK